MQTIDQFQGVHDLKFLFHIFPVSIGINEQEPGNEEASDVYGNLV